MAKWQTLAKFVRQQGNRTVTYHEGAVLDDAVDPVQQMVLEGAPIVEEPEEATAFPGQARSTRVPMSIRVLAWAAQLWASLRALAAVHVYVSGLNGSDENDGRSSTQPMATIDAAIEKYALAMVLRDVFIHVGVASAAAPYTLTALQRPRAMLGNLFLVGDGAGQPGEDGFTVLASGTADVGSGRLLVVTAGGLGVDTLIGRTIEITAAANPANVGARRLIQQHTDTDVVPTLGFPAALSSGDSWRIVEPAVQTASLSGQLLHGGTFRNSLYQNATLGRLFIVNLILGTTGTGFITGAWAFFGAKLNSIQIREGFINAGGDSGAQDSGTITTGDAAIVTELFELADDQSWLGWGLHMAGSATLSLCRGRLHGFVSEARVTITNMSQLFINTGRISGSSNSFAALTLSRASFAEITNAGSGGVSGAQTPFLVRQPNTGAAAHGVEATTEGYARLGSVRVELGGTAAAGVRVTLTSFAELGIGAAFPVVAGGAAGFLANRQGRGGVSGTGAAIADGTTPPTVNYAAGEGTGQVTAASFAAAGNALVGLSNDTIPVMDGSVISRF